MHTRSKAEQMGGACVQRGMTDQKSAGRVDAKVACSMGVQGLDAQFPHQHRSSRSLRRPRPSGLGPSVVLARLGPTHESFLSRKGQEQISKLFASLKNFRESWRTPVTHWASYLPQSNCPEYGVKEEPTRSHPMDNVESEVWRKSVTPRVPDRL